MQILAKLLADMIPRAMYFATAVSIHAKPIHNHDAVSLHFNHFYCTQICDKLIRDFAIFAYIYLNLD